MTAAVQPDLGATLKNRRQECGLTLEEIATRTRIRRTYLQALEENRFDSLPGEAYITGFLRIYAGCLEMAPEDLLHQYREQVAGAIGAEDPSGALPFSPLRRNPLAGPLPWIAVGLLIVVAIALASLRHALFSPVPLALQANPAPVLPSLPAAATVPAEAAPPALPEEKIAQLEPSGPALKPSATQVEAIPVAAPAASGGKPLNVDFPGIAMLRLESLGPNRIEFRGDDRPSQQYDLTAPAVLSWKVKQSGRLVVANPAAVRVWLDRQPLELNGRQEVLLHSIQMAGSGSP